MDLVAPGPARTGGATRGRASRVAAVRAPGVPVSLAVDPFDPLDLDALLSDVSADLNRLLAELREPLDLEDLAEPLDLEPEPLDLAVLLAPVDLSELEPLDLPTFLDPPDGLDLQAPWMSPRWPLLDRLTVPVLDL